MIWNRYILREFAQCIATFTLCFYFLYILIDYASHSDWFYFNGRFHWNIFLNYYSCDAAHRFTAVAPFILLLSTIKVVSGLVASNELLAMMASGVTVKQLLRPLLITSCAFLLILYLNLEFINPGAIQTVDALSDAHKQTHRNAPGIHQISLADGTTLLFKKYDSSRDQLFDVYWIKSISDLYHMKTLKFETNPTATYVDRFERNMRGELLKTESIKETTFPAIKLSKEGLNEVIIQPEDQPLSKLWQKMRNKKFRQEAPVVAAFYHKLVLPWLCVLAMIAPIPFCLNFTRKVPLFMIYACSLFGLAALTILLGSAFLLGKKQILDPVLATLLPSAIILSYFSRRYIKLTN